MNIEEVKLNLPGRISSGLLDLASCISPQRTLREKTKNFLVSSPLDEATESRNILRKNEAEIISIPLQQFEDLAFKDFIISTSQTKFYFKSAGTVCAVSEELLKAFKEISSDYRQTKLCIDFFTELMNYISEVSGSKNLRIAVRTHFWPLDAIWHLDRLSTGGAENLTRSNKEGIRLVWAPGRKHGTNLTPLENFKVGRWTALMLKNRTLIREAYQAFSQIGSEAGSLLLKNPSIEKFMDLQDRYLLKDLSLITRIEAQDASIQRMGIPIDKRIGTPHRVDLRNVDQPGLQFYITAAMT